MNLDRFEILRFPMIALVVFLHAKGAQLNMAEGKSIEIQSNPTLDLLQAIISDGISRIAVPLFFLMSGYLFFRTYESFGRSYLPKLAARVTTLLVPFLFWTTAAFTLMFILQSWPPTSGFFNAANAIAPMTWAERLDLLWGLTQPPAAYQFWFIRDLIVLAVASPAIFLIASRPLLWPTLAVALALWTINVWPIYIPSSEAFTYFLIGAALAVRNISPFWADRFGGWLPLAYLAALALSIACRDLVIGWSLHQITKAVGVATLLYLSGLVRPGSRIWNSLTALSGASFFVFATHEPLLMAMRKLAFRFLPPAPSYSTAIYILAPTIVILITLASYYGARILAPGLIAIITGGRAQKAR